MFEHQLTLTGLLISIDLGSLEPYFKHSVRNLGAILDADFKLDKVTG